MRKITMEDAMGEASAQLKEGAFLLAGGDVPNAMTIGWCQWGVVWKRPTCTVFVRKSRYTYDLMQSGLFTISVPKEGTMKKELAYCGTKSGRDVNKAQELGFTFTSLGDGLVPALSGCNIHFACKTLLHVDFETDKLQKDMMDETLLKHYYGANQKLGNGDPHTVFFGEIIGAYRE